MSSRDRAPIPRRPRRAFRAGAWVFLPAAGLLGQIACQDSDPPLGPCVHEYRDPLFTVAAATDSATGLPLAQFALAGATVDGQPAHVSQLITVFTEGIELDGDTLRCTVPCAFGTEEGAYAFSVSAPGYGAKQLSYEAAYGVFHGGCPSWNEDGLEISFELAPTAD